MAIFGKGADNSDLMHQILNELAALRQQVDGQQHAIDQARQDTNAAITSGLAEIRAVARDGIARSNEAIGEPVTRISTELVSIRAALNDLGRPAQAEPTTPPASEGPNPMADSLPTADPAAELLTAAAGISAAELQMHRDTWAFLIEQTAGDQHFHIPGKVDDQHGAVVVHVSGPSIVAAITSLDQVARTAPNPVTRAIAGHLHKRLTETVEEIITSPHRGGGADPVRIVIDDRAKPASRDGD